MPGFPVHHLLLELAQTHGYRVGVHRVQLYSWTIKESWAPKNWCFWTVVLEKTLESPLDLKEIKPIKPGDAREYDQPRQRIKKQRHYFANKGPYHQSYGFPSSRVWIWELDHERRLSAQELMLLNCDGENTLEIARRSNQSILKEINPEYSLEELVLSGSSNILATWCEEMTHWKRPWCWERLRAREEGRDRGWDGIIYSMKMSFSKLQEMVKDRGAWYATVHGGHKELDTT